MKYLVAKAIAERVQDGQVLGLGTGSTASLAIEEIGKRVEAEGLKVSGIPTSNRSAELANKLGIQVLSFDHPGPIDWAFDGADEVDKEFNLIKGAGGALLREKSVAKRAGGIVVIVTEDKLVTTLGENFAVPVEVEQGSEEQVSQALLALGASSVVLRGQEVPYVTDNRNFILDARFLPAQAQHEAQINSIEGVLDNGIFVGLTTEVLVATADGTVQQKQSKS